MRLSILFFRSTGFAGNFNLKLYRCVHVYPFFMKTGQGLFFSDDKRGLRMHTPLIPHHPLQLKDDEIPRPLPQKKEKRSVTWAYNSVMRRLWPSKEKIGKEGVVSSSAEVLRDGGGLQYCNGEHGRKWSEDVHRWD